MSVGTQPSVPQVNNQLTTLAINLRNDLRAIASFNEYVIALGATGLENLGFSSTDAASVLTMASYMNTISEVYQGTQGQAPSGQAAADFDFDNALCGLWAGQ